MEQSIVYLSGPISGLTFTGCTDWREYVSKAFPSHIVGASPLRAKSFLAGKGTIDGSYEDNPLATSRGINARDHFDTLRSKVVLVNLLGCLKSDPKTRVSIGTVAEMAWAWDHRIIIVCAMEKEGNIHEHPMLNEWIDYRVDNLDEAIKIAVAVISANESQMVSNLSLLHMLGEGANANGEGQLQTAAN